MPYTVTFRFEEKDHASVVLQAHEGDTLLELALDNGIELQHNCGGVCACSTCHVYVERGMDDIAELTDKEEDFIDRAVNPRLTSRLACQCEILTGDVDVLVPDQSQFMGH